jgi:hexosaminidase
VWEQIINAQIIPPGLTAEEKARVLGAEACMWGEVTDQFFIDQKLWLRASVLAERLWTPNATINAYCQHKPW